MLVAILPQGNDSKTQHSYILVHVETIDNFKIALVDPGTCYNVISSKLYNTLNNVTSTRILHDIQSSLVEKYF